MSHTCRGRASFCTRSASVRAPAAPSFAIAATASAERSCPTPAIPARIVRRNMFAPIRPRPIIPSCIVSLSPAESRPCGRRRRGICCRTSRASRIRYIGLRIEARPRRRGRMPAPVLVVENRDALADRFAILCEQAALRAIAARKRFVLVIPGGSAAEKFLPRLGTARIDWGRTDVFYTDERFVSRSNPASSAAASRAFLFDALGDRGPRVHPMVAAEVDPNDTAAAVAAAQRYEEELVATLGGEPEFDLTLVGVGEDGHVASLFPNRPAVEERTGMVLIESASPKPPSLRLTLSLPLLSASRAVVVAAFGQGKAQVVRTLLRDAGSRLPVWLLLRRVSDTTVMVDPEAAGALSA